MTKAMPVPMDDWEIKNAVDTLQKAEEIQSNPAMMKKVKAEAMKQKKALDKVVTKTAPKKKKTTAKRKK